MLKRIYADNFMCLVDFEYRPGSLECLVGRPGSGRSAVWHLLDQVQHLLLGHPSSFSVAEVFPEYTVNRWRPDVGQRVEIELEAHECHFHYYIETECGPDEDEVRLVREELRCDDQLLFSFADEMGSLYIEGSPAGTPRKFDGASSALRRAIDGHDDERVQWFFDWWRELWLASIGVEMEAPREGEADKPGSYFYDYVPWFRHLQKRAPERIASLNTELTVLFDGLIRLQLGDSSDDRSDIEAVYPHPDSNTEQAFPLQILAHEERMLIFLYSLVYLGVHPGRVMYIDTPQAALDSADMERWLDLFLTRANAAGMQALVAINESSLLEALPEPAAVRRFMRSRGGPARVSPPHDT